MSFEKYIAEINSRINSVVWGPVMLLFLVGTGVYLTFGTGFLQVFKFGCVWKKTLGSLSAKDDNKDKRNVTPFQAVSTALASTVGTGNVVGVATAIVAGGAGAVFWMWVSAFFGMVTKYAEVVLAVYFRRNDKNGVHYGGPMYYIEKGLGLKSLAAVFAVLGAFASFGIGNMLQANAIATAIEVNFNVEPLYSGIAIAVMVGLVIMGGITRIAKVTEKLVPFMAVFYTIGTLIAIAVNYRHLPAAIEMIFEEAFNLNAAGGGIMGFTVTRGMRYGIARGVFSNEAGLGSAPIAHAASNAKNPVEQGFWGIIEVFVDTIVMCTLTALVVLTSGLTQTTKLDGSPLTSAAFSQVMGPFGGIFVTIALFFFALATIIGWSYYGECCLRYIFGANKLAGFIYKAIYTVFVVVGSVGGLQLMWDIADTLNGAMAVPNLAALLWLSGTVFRLSRNYMKNPKSVEMRDV